MDFPLAFEERVKQDPFLGEELLLALNKETPTAIRLNVQKGKHLFDQEKAIPWSQHGKWLTERPVFTLDPAFHGGAYYPQEAGSQLLDSVLRQLKLPENPVVLDLCAAPGGKSTLILDVLGENGLLVSNEIIPNRAKILKENLTKWGRSNSIVTSNAPKDFQALPELFDLVVIDAPCSGEGMFRKDTEARNEWSEANVEMCATRQQDIVDAIWDSIKPGGYIVYSTCTFNSMENEDNVSWMQEELDAQYISVQSEYAVTGRNNLGFYGLPHKMDTEGFYIAVLRKDLALPQQQKHKKWKSNLTEVNLDGKLGALVKSDDHKLVQWNKFVFAIPASHSDTVARIQHAMHVIKLGTEIGEITQKGLVPNPALAFDENLIAETVQQLELTREEALKYLKGDTFNLAGNKGFSIVKYNGINLGWINHLGNRFNNLYPKEWRIRMRID